MRIYRIFIGLFFALSVGIGSAQVADSTAVLLCGKWKVSAMGAFDVALKLGQERLADSTLPDNDRKALQWDIDHLQKKYQVVLDSAYVLFQPNGACSAYITPDSYHPLEIRNGLWQLNYNNPREIEVAVRDYYTTLYIDTLTDELLVLLTDRNDPRNYWKLVREQ